MPSFTWTRTSPSTPGSPAAHPSHSPCSASPRLSQAGRPGSVHSATPVSTAAPSGFAMPATICLCTRQIRPGRGKTHVLHPPLRISRQMRPSLSIACQSPKGPAAVGHYVSIREITTPHPRSVAWTPRVCPTHQYWDGIFSSGTVLWAGSWDTPREGTALDETHPLRDHVRHIACARE